MHGKFAQYVIHIIAIKFFNCNKELDDQKLQKKCISLFVPL